MCNHIKGMMIKSSMFMIHSTDQVTVNHKVSEYDQGIPQSHNSVHKTSDCGNEVDS